MTLIKLSSAVGRALSVSAVLLLAFGGGFAEAQNCSNKNQNNCNNGCVWEDGACYNEGEEPSATTPAPSPGGGSPGSTPAPTAQIPCEREWNSNANKFRNTNNNNMACPDGFTCDVGEFDTGADDTAIPGVCISEECAGNADNELTGNEDGGTVRVTICHRTCSEANPWVRITIDDDAWGDVDYDGDGIIDGNGASGCGHQREHDVREDCNKAPWLPWGGQYKDYVLRVHGTRDFVRTSNGFNDQQEREYWRTWERACPFVRSIKDNNPCCDWAAGECCGEFPGLPPPGPGDYTCAFPNGMADHSVVVEKNCYFAGGTVQGDVSCGGTIRATGSLTINGFLEARFLYQADDITLAGGSKLLATDVPDQYSADFYHTDATDLTIDYFYFAWIAEYAESGTENGYTVIVRTSGGEVSNDSFGVTCTDGDKVLVVFDTTDIVTIVPGAVGNCFGASIIAPKSLVIIGKAGSIPATVDGLVVAKTLDVPAGSVTFNENPYAGPLFCEGDTPAPSPGPTSNPVDCKAIVSRGIRTTERRCETEKCGKKIAVVTVIDETMTETREFSGTCNDSSDGSPDVGQYRNLVNNDDADGDSDGGSGGESGCECVLAPDVQAEADAWINEVDDIKCTSKKCSGQTNGDPHFKTFDGKKYDFHGECDLVATSSPTFASNKGLDIHIRTTIKDTWSKITGAAVRIGDDIFEIDALDAVKKLKFVKIYFNKKPVTNDSLPATIGGLPFQKLDKDGVLYKITVNEHEELLISSFSGMVKVRVHAHIHDASGMLGTRAKPGLVGRDGETMLSPNGMGDEWQVRPDDHPILFSTSRAPQYPAGCVMPPEAPARRLGQDSALRSTAEGACEGIEDPEEIDDCIFDVMQTGDVNMALDYH